MPLTKVCITMRITNAQGYDEPRDSISHDWSERLISWGKTPMPIPNIGPLAVDYLKQISPDLLILSGGEDIGVSPIRDQTEIALLKYAIETRLPVFGVCRGLQLINTYFGGTLAPVGGHVAQSHEIHFDAAWGNFYGTSECVNSYHNTCIPAGGLAAALRATAADADNNIEAAEHRELPLSAVMWHPERAGGLEGDRNLVNALTERAQG